MSRSIRRPVIRAIAATAMVAAVTSSAAATAQAETVASPGAQPASASRDMQEPPQGATPVDEPEDAVEAVREAGPKTSAVLGGLYKYPSGEVRTMLIDLENYDGTVRWRLRGDCHGYWRDTEDTSPVSPDYRDLTEPWYKFVPFPQSCGGGPIG